MNPNQKHNNEQKDKQNKNIAKCQDSNKWKVLKLDSLLVEVLNYSKLNVAWSNLTS